MLKQFCLIQNKKVFFVEKLFETTCKLYHIRHIVLQVDCYSLLMMNDRHPSPDYPRDEKQPGDPVHQKGQIRPGSAQSGHGPPPSSLGPPPSYTTVTMTTDNTPGARVTEINLNIGYYKTLPGILKIVQMVISNILIIS